jgi:hypothetical protein
LLGGADKQEHGNQVEVDPGTVGTQRPASPWLLREAIRLRLCDHGQQLREQLRPGGWRLTIGTARSCRHCRLAVADGRELLGQAPAEGRHERE